MEMLYIENLRQYMGLKTQRHNKYKPKSWLKGWKLNRMESILFNVPKNCGNLEPYLLNSPVQPVADVIMDIYLNYPTPSVVRVAKWCCPEHFKIDSRYWESCREQVFASHPHSCVYCGATDNLHVDHKLPKSKYPHLTYVIANLQLLCASCNKKKSTKVKPEYLIELKDYLSVK